MSSLRLFFVKLRKKGWGDDRSLQEYLKIYSTSGTVYEKKSYVKRARFHSHEFLNVSFLVV